MYKILIILAFLGFTNVMHANILDKANKAVDKHLNKLQDKFGIASNLNGPSVYQDQAAGSYSAGSAFIRIPQKNVNLISTSLPNYKMGCGGIDAHLGSFSHISSKEIVSVLKSIGTSLPIQGVMLYAQRHSPTIYNGLSYWLKMLQDLNTSNINSCEMSAALLGGMVPASEANSAYTCANMGTKSGGLFNYKDRLAAKHACNAKGKRRDILGKTNDSDNLVEQFNIAWQAIQKSEFLKNDTELAEIFMTLSGTIVFNAKDDGTTDVQHLPSKLRDNNLLNAMLNGGDVEIYTCMGKDDTLKKCLNVAEKSKNISDTEALTVRIENMMSSMLIKGRGLTEGLTNEEKALISSVATPILKIIKINNLYPTAANPIWLQEVAEIASMEMMISYTEQVIETMLMMTEQLSYAQSSDKLLKEFRSELKDVQQQVYAKKHGFFQYSNLNSNLIERTVMLEQHAIKAMSGQRR